MEAELNARDGCAGVVRLSRLKPETNYRYAVSLRRGPTEAGGISSLHHLSQTGRAAFILFCLWLVLSPAR
ncbi:MAG: hypothetical protein HND47_18200 [Chloroflexi bacterium]|nr:hypothetical protein [Chloroflexota bacterium]